MPPGFIKAKITHTNYPINNSFNALSILTFRQELISEITEILSILKEVITTIYKNNEAFIINCGVDYLHYLLKMEK